MNALSDYISAFIGKDTEALRSALHRWQTDVFQHRPEEIRVLFVQAASHLLNNEAFIGAVLDGVPAPSPIRRDKVEAYASAYSDVKLAELLLHPPDLLLTTLLFYSPERLNSEPFYPLTDGRTEFKWRTGGAEASVVHLLIDRPENNYPDLYAGRAMPFNGDPEDFAYEYHLPLYRLIRRYFPDRSVCISTAPPKDRNAPYIYVLSPRHLPVLRNKFRQRLFTDGLPRHVREDMSRGRALVIWNSAQEGFQWSADIRRLARATRQMPANTRGQLMILSGSSFDPRAAAAFRSRRPIGRKRLDSSLLDWFASLGRPPIPDILSFPYFEESVRALSLHFLPEVNVSRRLEQLRRGEDVRHFLCMNRVVKDFRVALSYFFWSHRLMERSLVSQAAVGERYPAGKPILQVPNKEEFEAFRASLPWTLDTEALDVNLWNVLPDDIIGRSVIWVVSETNFDTDSSGRHLFMTEKTFKPLACGMPFIIAGNAGMLQRLRGMGYQTFSHWWDESYDLEGRRQKRMDKLRALIYSISRLEIGELLDMVEEMQPVLEHNRRVLMQSRAGEPVVKEIIRRYDALQTGPSGINPISETPH